MNLPESKLFAPVKAWLTAQGFVVFAEAWGHDIVAIRGDEIVTVELKMSFSRRLWQQCGSASPMSDRVYAASPTVCRKPPECYRDIGILRVTDETVVIVREPVGKPWKPMHDRAVQALRNRVPDETVVGGVPVLAGEGPRQRCRKRCAEYVRAHPKATWKDLYEHVDNHYAHHRSMAGALGGSHAMNHWRESEPVKAEQQEMTFP